MNKGFLRRFEYSHKLRSWEGRAIPLTFSAFEVCLCFRVPLCFVLTVTQE